MNVARGNLGLSAWGLFTPIIVTHVSIRASDTSSRLFNLPSQAYRTLLYRAQLPKECAPRASVHRLAPLNLPRRPTRPVSYYAFFKGWLLLSQPPDCLCLPTSFPTKLSLGGLSWRSGLFPSRVRTLAPGALSPVKALVGIRSLPWFSRALCPPSHNSALPPTVCLRGTTSIVFGENQLFPDLFGLSPLPTAHRRTFATVVRSALQLVLPNLRPGHGKSFGFGSKSSKLIPPVRPPFPSPSLNGLAFYRTSLP